MSHKGIENQNPSMMIAIIMLGFCVVFCLSLINAACCAYADDGMPQLTSGDTAQPTRQEVADMILGLSADPSSFTESDTAHVKEIQAAYEALDPADQEALDTQTGHPDTGQPLGRVLESALWAVSSYGEVDNDTALPDGTYNAYTIPALSSEYSKGKSTSGRQKPWSVKSIRVQNGKAYATVAVESDTYSGVWMGGVVYPKTNSSGNCEFADIPVKLNSTFYFAGISTSMPTPIAFSLTTSIEVDNPEPQSALDIAKKLIAALPADPDVVKGYQAGIEKATAAYEALTDAERAELDSIELDKDQSYGRWLESAQWGLLALQPVDNSTDLVNGDYSDVVSSSSSMGKSNSARGRTWSVVELTVADGKATATISCRKKSLFRNMRVGGLDYTAKVDSAGIPYFTVPIALGKTMSFTVDFNSKSDLNDNTDSIAYQLNSSVAKVAASDDRIKSAAAFADRVLSEGDSIYTPETGPAVIAAAKNLKSASEKKGVTFAELSAATKLLSDTIAASKTNAPKESTNPTNEQSGGSQGSSSSSSSGSTDSDDGAGSKTQSSAKSNTKTKNLTTPGNAQSSAAQSQGGKTVSVPTVSKATSVGGNKTAVPQVTKQQETKKTNAEQSERSSASASKNSTGKEAESMGANSAASAQTPSISEVNLERIEDAAKAGRLSEVIAVAAAASLLLLGMCVRTFIFVRGRG